MKAAYSCLIALALGFSINAQDVAGTIFNGAGAFSRVMGVQPDMMDAIHRVSGLKFTTSKRLEGSPFFDEEYWPGYIIFFNDKVLRDIPLKYNDLNNELYFEDQGREMILQTVFKEFGFSVKQDELTKSYFFRSGFPAIATNTDKTFYQVLSENKYVLLKNSEKTVRESKEPNGMEFLRITTADTYFAYDSAAKNIVKIKNSIGSITGALPTEKEQIELICKQEGLKCKSEKELIALFSRLR